jgi:PAS domain S-box-containing protein
MTLSITNTSCSTFDLLRRQLTLVDTTAKFYSAAFEQAADAMVVIDDLGRVHAANAAVCHLFSVDQFELVGRRIQDLLPADLNLREIARKLRDRGEASLEFDETLPGGNATSMSVTARQFHPQRYVLSFHDISQEKRLERALERAHDQETLSHGAAAIVHDVNNLLMPIVSYADSLAKREVVDPELAQMVDELRAVAERASSLARKLLSITRPAPDKPSAVKMNEMLGQMTGMLARVAGESIELVLRLDPELVNVRVDRERLELLVLNLVLNACDAMPKGGKLIVQTTNVKRSGGAAEGAPPGAGSMHAVVAVTDTGVGMDAETRKRIFEPFFTTKPKGTGLGLSAALSFMKRSGGHIEVDSELGRGTTFRLYLPEA